MARKRYTAEEIIGHLRTVEIDLGKGSAVPEACRKLGITEQTYYRWKKEYGGLRVDQAKRLKGLEQENARSYPSTERDVIRFPLSHSLSQQCPIRLVEMESSVTL